MTANPLDMLGAVDADFATTAPSVVHDSAWSAVGILAAIAGGGGLLLLALRCILDRGA